MGRQVLVVSHSHLPSRINFEFPDSIPSFWVGPALLRHNPPKSIFSPSLEFLSFTVMWLHWVSLSLHMLSLGEPFLAGNSGSGFSDLTVNFVIPSLSLFVAHFCRNHHQEGPLHSPSQFNNFSPLSAIPVSGERYTDLYLPTSTLTSSYFLYHILNFQEVFLMFCSFLYFIASCLSPLPKCKNQGSLPLYCLCFLGHFCLGFISSLSFMVAKSLFAPGCQLAIGS